MASAVLQTQCITSVAAMSPATPSISRSRTSSVSLRTSRQAATELVSRSGALRTRASESEQQPTSGSTPAVPPPTPVVPTPPAPKSPTLDGIMAFDGAPEIINGRLAMLGLTTGVIIELTRGVSILDQTFAPTQHGLVYGLMAMGLFTAASIIPYFQSKPGSPPPSFLFFNTAAEKTNGRLAMLGFVGLYLVEFLGGHIIA